MKTPTRIYHITHIENLEGILQAGGLWAKNHLTVTPTSVAYAHVQSVRAAKSVPVPPGGTLHDYVPFYFCPRSPMLYALHDPVQDQMHYQGGQKPMLHLVSTVQKASQTGLKFVFTDRHPLKAYAQFFSNLADLAQLDWNAIQARQWFNTQQQPERKEKKQAEFLVHAFFPWDHIDGIGVLDVDMAKEVQKIFVRFPKKGRIVWVKPQWYY